MKNTMTVARLVAELVKYPASTPVFATWEGVLAPILPENFSLESSGDDIDPSCLVIDVEDY